MRLREALDVVGILCNGVPFRWRGVGCGAYAAQWKKRDGATTGHVHIRGVFFGKARLSIPSDEVVLSPFSGMPMNADVVVDEHVLVRIVDFDEEVTLDVGGGHRSVVVTEDAGPAACECGLGRPRRVR